MKKENFNVNGMSCAACVANVEKCVKKIDGVIDANVNLLSASMSVTYDEARATSSLICDAVSAAGYKTVSREDSERSSTQNEWERRREETKKAEKSLLLRFVSSAAILVPLMIIAMSSMPTHSATQVLLEELSFVPISASIQLVLSLAVLIINKSFFSRGIKSLLHKAPNMDTLVCIGSGASFLYGAFALFRIIYGFATENASVVSHYSHQLYFESAAMILTLVTLGKYFESRSKRKTSDALTKLSSLAPKTASVIRDGKEITIPAEALVAGDVIVVRAGEAIPADGELIEGEGFVDESAVTGEAMPKEKAIGDKVISATVNKNGFFKMRAERVGENTTLSQIIRLVDEASASKAPISRLADKVSGIFVPSVIAISLLTAAVWLAFGAEFEFALTCAISVLVISCPCALGLATPVAIMVSTGKAAELGILIKSAEALETLCKIDTVVLDKTGTLTSGHPLVTDVIPLDNEFDEESLLWAAASIESASSHPLAEAIVSYAESKKLSLCPVSDFSVETGLGICASFDSSSYIAGNLRFMSKRGVTCTKEATEILNSLAKSGKTPMLFAKDGKLFGIIAVADTPREDSKEAVSMLHDMGIKTLMLTGDNALAAEAVRVLVGVDEAVSDLLPADKEAKIRELRASGRKVAMVGDGINDAPALVSADVGIAIGAGTDVAIDAAEVVLMKDSLFDAVCALRLSRSTVRNIKGNLFWAFFYNVLGIPVAAGVLYPLFSITLTPMIGAAAMSASSVCVVSNALLLRRFKCNHKNVIKENKENTEMTKTLMINGMMCDHCRMHAEKALKAVKGVAEVKVSLEEKKAEITLSKKVDDKVLIKAVTDAGYEASVI